MEKGSYKVIAKFDGDHAYIASNASIALTVTPSLMSALEEASVLWISIIETSASFLVLIIILRAWRKRKIAHTWIP